MHELMACTASMIIMMMFIAQTAANTNTFIEAVYCERTVSDYVEDEYDKEEIPGKIRELQENLEKMPGVRTDLNGNDLDIYLDGIIGPAHALMVGDNSIHIEKKLELKMKETEDEESYDGSGDPYGPDAFEQDSDGDDFTDPLGDIRGTGRIEENE